MELALSSASCSVQGRRENNEDAVFCSPRLVAVADGVGGAAGGEVASRWAINHMSSLEKRLLTRSLDDELAAAVIDANSTIGFLIRCRPQLAGMATTLNAVALSNDREYLITNIGDSRTYLHRLGELTQLSRDQSYVQHLVDQGYITPREARVHPQRSIVLEALDGSDRAIRAPGHHRAFSGDRLLLCSDGISDYLEDGEIASLLKFGPPRAAAEALVSAALDSGSRDNVSAVVADLVANRDPSEQWADAA